MSPAPLDEKSLETFLAIHRHHGDAPLRHDLLSEPLSSRPEDAPQPKALFNILIKDATTAAQACARLLDEASRQTCPLLLAITRARRVGIPYSPSPLVALPKPPRSTMERSRSSDRRGPAPRFTHRDGCPGLFVAGIRWRNGVEKASQDQRASGCPRGAPGVCRVLAPFRLNEQRGGLSRPLSS